jgi:hypothetical protein
LNLNRLKAQSWRTDLNHQGRTVLCRLLDAILKVFKRYSFIQLSGNPEFRRYLAPSIVCIFLEEAWTAFPALAAAYAALSFYHHIDHKIILNVGAFMIFLSFALMLLIGMAATALKSAQLFPPGDDLELADLK